MSEDSNRFPPDRCTFCGYGIPQPVTPRGSPPDQFCSTACQEAFAEGQAPFANALGFKRRAIGVSLLERALPDGIPSYATILLAGEEGTRTEGLMLEILWRALQRGEPALLVPVDKPPTTMIDAFLAHGWNVIPYLDAGQFMLLDMYTQRIEDQHVYENRNNEWSNFLLSALEPSIHRTRDPSDLHAVANNLDQACGELDMTNQGLVAIDDLTELASYTPELQAINFLKEARALVSKARDVPLWTGASESRTEGLYPTKYPQSYEYLFDGIVDLELNDTLVAGERIKRASVRKMEDVTVNARWLPYEFNGGSGFVPVDPS